MRINSLRRWAPLLAPAAAGAVYWQTLAPTVTFGDAGSFIAAAHCLGVAHPPGYPLWCAMAHFFTRLPWGNVAWRINIFSAVCAAAAVGMIYLTVLRLTRQPLAAWCAALTAAFNKILWSQAVIAEVYCLYALLCIAFFYCALRWRTTGKRRWLYAMAATGGLGAAHHHLFILLAPIIVIWALYGRTSRLKSYPAHIAAAVLLGLAITTLLYAYLPWRAQTQPPVNWGNAVNPAAAIRHMLRLAYFTEPEQVRYIGRLGDIFQFIRAGFQQCADALTWPVVLPALLGGACLIRRRPDLAGATLGLIFANTAGLSFLLRGTAAPDEIHARQVFYTVVPLFLSLWLGYGLHCILALARLRNTPSAARVTLGLCLLLPLYPLQKHWPANDRSRDTLAEHFARQILASAPANAGLFFVQDEFLFPVLYCQVVEKTRPDVHIISSREFGYQGQPLSTILCDVPPNAALQKYYPILRNTSPMPWGLVYRLTHESAPAADSMLLENAWPAEAPQHAIDDTPSDRIVRAAYAANYARLGLEYFLCGDTNAAHAAWQTSEELKGADPYAHYLLAQIYRHCGINSDRRRQLLHRAQALYQELYYPAGFRFYPITADEIASAIAEEDDYARKNHTSEQSAPHSGNP